MKPRTPTRRLGVLALQALEEELARLLREVLREQTIPPSDEEPAGALPPALDVGAYLLWVITGMRLFRHGELPSLEAGTMQTQRLLLLLAQLQCGGNISQMTVLLSSSRRTIREGLRRHGLYTTPPSPRELQPNAQSPVDMDEDPL